MNYEEAARRAQKAFEPFCAMIYFVPEAAERYRRIGLNRRQGYFCSRSAAMGQVSGPVVAATFYNFNPAYVVPLVESGWQAASPAAVLEERRLAVQEAAHRLLAPSGDKADLLPGAARATESLKAATAELDPAGRPLFAAHQALDWPADELGALWHGVNLLREYRGDGHIAALLVEGVSGAESLLLQTAYSSRGNLDLLLQSRQWDPAAIEAARDRLAGRGLLRDGALTEQGRQVRERIEQHTDRLAARPFQMIGESGTTELLDYMSQVSRRVVERGALAAVAAPTKTD